MRYLHPDYHVTFITQGYSRGLERLGFKSELQLELEAKREASRMPEEVKAKLRALNAERRRRLQEKSADQPTVENVLMTMGS